MRPPTPITVLVSPEIEGQMRSLAIVTLALAHGFKSTLTNEVTAPRVVNGGAGDSGTQSAPSLFTAIQEIGLKLEPAKAPLEVVVIEGVQRPSEN